jgi:hypothetical protein
VDVEVREARPEEPAETEVVTADAYRELFSDTDLASYIEEVGDVAGRAEKNVGTPTASCCSATRSSSEALTCRAFS